MIANRLRGLLAPGVLLALMAPLPADAVPQARPAPILIGVLDLDANNVEEGEARAISDRLRYHLGNQPGFRVLERGRMVDILAETGFQLSGACDTDECVVQVGRILGVQKMVAGSVSRVGSIYAIQVRLVDIATSAIERQAINDVDGIEAVFSVGTLKVASELAGAMGAASAAAPPTGPAVKQGPQPQGDGWALGVWVAGYPDPGEAHQGLALGHLRGDARLFYAGWLVGLGSETTGTGGNSVEVTIITDVLRSRTLRPYIGIGRSRFVRQRLSVTEEVVESGLTVGLLLEMWRLMIRVGSMPASGGGTSVGLLWDFSSSRRP